MAGLFASWVHGSAGLPERALTPSKFGVQNAFRNSLEFDGDIVNCDNWMGLAIARGGVCARFVAFDIGAADTPKSGGCWIHYPIPTPVIVDGIRAKFRKVLIKHTTPIGQKLGILRVHVHDGDRLVFAQDDILSMDPGVWVRDLPADEVLWGVVVSVFINANNAQNNYLDIFGVGVDFEFQ